MDATMNATVGAVSVVNPEGTEETGADRPAAPDSPKRTRARGPNKKTRAMVDDAYRRGWDDCLERDKPIGPAIMGCLGLGLGLGIGFLFQIPALIRLLLQ